MQEKPKDASRFYPGNFLAQSLKFGGIRHQKQSYTQLVLGTGQEFVTLSPSEGSDVQMTGEIYQYPEISTLENEILRNKSIISNLQNHLLKLKQVVENNTKEIFAIKQNLNLEKIYRFASYTNNWDGYGAPPIDKKVIDKSIKFIFEKNLITQPSVFPTGRGTIQFEFEPDENHYMEIEIFKNYLNYLSIVYSEEEELEKLDWEEIIKKVNDFQSKFSN